MGLFLGGVQMVSGFSHRAGCPGVNDVCILLCRLCLETGGKEERWFVMLL